MIKEEYVLKRAELAAKILAGYYSGSRFIHSFSCNYFGTKSKEANTLSDIETALIIAQEILDESGVKISIDKLRKNKK